MGLSGDDRSLPGHSGSASIVAGSAVPSQEFADMTESAPGTARCRILVIEDEMLIGMLLEDMLVDLGHEVAAVIPRLKDALTAAQRETFDLAILDVHLHGESAFPVADALIARVIPFVFATGYGQRGLPETYRERPVLQKPFARDDLERVLRLLLA
jgi:CheY-like chemotaxis protein